MLDDGQQAQSVGSREPTHGGDCNTLGPFGFRACIGLPEAKPISHLERQIQGDRCTVCILALITIACGPMDCNPIPGNDYSDPASSPSRPQQQNSRSDNLRVLSAA